MHLSLFQFFSLNSILFVTAYSPGHGYAKEKVQSFSRNNYFDIFHTEMIMKLKIFDIATIAYIFNETWYIM